MTSSWLAQIVTMCPKCKKQSMPISFTLISKNNVTQILDNHFCKYCGEYFDTMTTAHNYLLLYQNNLSKQTPPISFDPQYGAVL